MMRAARILLVDDEASIQRALAPPLRSRGYDVDVVGSGADALQAMQLNPPDLIVLDRNPLEDIKNIGSVSMVMKDGKLIDRQYHADFAMPIPRPKMVRPVWLEVELKKSEK